MAWVCFYTIERLLAPLTDAVVTINQEDYDITCRYKFAKGKNYKINGVGVDLGRFSPVSHDEKLRLRHEIGIKPDAFVLLYTAQFIPRKNHRMIIKALPELKRHIPTVVVLFAGNGPTWDSMKQLAGSLGVADSIEFLGGRRDIERLCRISDLHIATSMLEGQGINNIEAMACGCPLVVSRVRGHKDVCIDGRNGFLFDLDKPQDMIANIIHLYEDKQLYHIISEFNKQDADRFNIRKEVAAMARIYNEVMSEIYP